MDSEEEIPLDSSSITTIRCDCESVYEQLAILQSKLIAQNDLGIGNVEALLFFAPQVKDDITGEWSVPRKARNFDDALSLMDEIAAELKAKESEKVSLDYYENAPVKTPTPAAAAPQPAAEEVAPRSSEPDHFVDDEVSF